MTCSDRQSAASLAMLQTSPASICQVKCLGVVVQSSLPVREAFVCQCPPCQQPRSVHQSIICNRQATCLHTQL